MRRREFLKRAAGAACGISIVSSTSRIMRAAESGERQFTPLFNGQNLDGWTIIQGGEWTIENGVLVGRNGRDWSTNPETTGSWLSTNREYADFRLEIEFMINERGNSGLFFRSSREKNPAFTGYEMQIYGAPGRPPSKGGPGSIYDLVAPTKNMIRAGDQWNSAVIIARGPRIQIEMNGERIIDTEQTRSMRGYIGLQNHDDRSVVKFRNIRIQTL